MTATRSGSSSSTDKKSGLPSGKSALNFNPEVDYFFLGGLTSNDAGILHLLQQYMTGPPFLSRTATVLVFVLVFESGIWQTGHGVAAFGGPKAPAIGIAVATKRPRAASFKTFFNWDSCGAEAPSVTITFAGNLCNRAEVNFTNFVARQADRIRCRLVAILRTGTSNA